MKHQVQKGRERREGRNQKRMYGDGMDTCQFGRIRELQEKMMDLSEGEAVLAEYQDLSLDQQELDLEDILAFESVGSGPSLFEGFKLHGLDLPFPDKLSEQQCARKVIEVLKALSELRIFLIGFENMTARELYSTLWHQTLWEGCYVKKRNPEAMTIIDVSQKMMRSEMMQFLEDMSKINSIH